MDESVNYAPPVPGVVEVPVLDGWWDRELLAWVVAGPDGRRGVGLTVQAAAAAWATGVV